MTTELNKGFYSPAEVAVILGVTRETVYNAIKSGEIKSFKFRRQRRITQDQILEALTRSIAADPDNSDLIASA